MTFRTFTAAELMVSEHNVRQNAKDATASPAIEDSIAGVGLIMPLIVHPLRKKQGKATHGVFDGGRRFRSIAKLIADKRIPADWPIDCVVRDLPPAEITELSLGAYLLARDLHPYEVNAAIAKAQSQGASIAEIARNLGQEDAWVRRQLRLGNLAPEIFDAYAQGKLSAEQAQAYAATEDQDLQRAAFKALGGVKDARWSSQHEIRRWLKIGDHELQQLLTFVGLQSYRAAGGTFELDLFYDGPDQRGRIADEGILRGLAETKIEELREDLRGELGMPDLRFVAQMPDAGLWYERSDAALPDGVVAHLAIGAKGTAEASFFWESRKARGEHERAQSRVGNASATADRIARDQERRPAGHPLKIHDTSGFDTVNSYTAAQAARAAVREEHGLTADGLHVLRSLRRSILRAVICADAFERGRHDYVAAAPGEGGTLGRDYLIWAQLRQVFGKDRPIHTGARRLADTNYGSEDNEPRDFVGSFIAENRAEEVWQSGLTMLRGEPFMTEPDPARSLELYVAYDEHLKNQFAAMLAGDALLRSANVPGWRIPAHDKLAQLAGADDLTIRKGWSPTPRFMGLLPKLKRLELAEPYADPTAFKGWSKKDDKSISAVTSAVLDPATHSDATIAAAAARWVHPLLAFPRSLATEPDAQGGEVDATTELEPAE